MDGINPRKNFVFVAQRLKMLNNAITSERDKETDTGSAFSIVFEVVRVIIVDTHHRHLDLSHLFLQVGFLVLINGDEALANVFDLSLEVFVDESTTMESCFSDFHFSENA